MPLGSNGFPVVAATDLRVLPLEGIRDGPDGPRLWTGEDDQMSR